MYTVSQSDAKNKWAPPSSRAHFSRAQLPQVRNPRPFCSPKSQICSLASPRPQAPTRPPPLFGRALASFGQRQWPSLPCAPGQLGPCSPQCSPYGRDLHGSELALCLFPLCVQHLISRPTHPRPSPPGASHSGARRPLEHAMVEDAPPKLTVPMHHCFFLW